MEKIVSFSVNETKNQSLLPFMSQYTNWFEVNPEIKAKVLPIYNNSIVPLSKSIELAVKKLQGSEHTATLVSIDARRGNAWTAFGYGIKMYLLHPDKEFSEPAKRLNVVAKNFRGLNDQEYGEQTGGVKAALKEYRGEYAPDVEKLGLTFWLDELEDANDDFEKSDDARDDQKAVRNAVDIKVVRKNVNVAIKMTSDLLNGLAFMEASDPVMAEKYDTAFRKLNVILKKFGSSSTTTTIPEVPTESPADDYPDAKEWVEDFGVQNATNGMIFYVIVDGKKVFYKLLDRVAVGFIPGGTKYQEYWEKLN